MTTDTLNDQDHDPTRKPSTNYKRGCRCTECVTHNRDRCRRAYYTTRGIEPPEPNPAGILFTNGPLKGQRTGPAGAHYGTITVAGHRYGSHRGTDPVEYVWLEAAR